MKRPLVLALAIIVPVAACDGFKEAMTAHVDVAARAGSQELSVTRLGELLGNSKVPLQRDVVKTVAELWVNYQLLARAAAHNDSLNDPAKVDEAMWSALTTTRLQKWTTQVSKTWTASADTTGHGAAYARGDLYAARHILFPAQAGNAASEDSARQKANAVRAELTSTNFAQLADRHNGPQAAPRPGGDLGVFPKGAMIPEFEKTVAGLKPGEISQPVKTQFGYHVIRRSTYDEVRDQFAEAKGQSGRAVAESTYVANLDASGKIQVRPNAAATLKALAADPEGHRDDKTVIATSTAGDLTAAKAGQWIAAVPSAPQLRQQIQGAPDSLLPNFVKYLVRNELLLRQADSAKVALDTSEVNEIRRAFVATLTNTWSGLNISPNRLADSAKTVSERERLAAARVDDYVERLLTKDEQFVVVPQALANALHAKYDSKVNAAGIDRALERAQRIRAVADSTRAAQQPQSAVPLPGQPGAPAPKPAAPPDSLRKP